VQQKKKRVTVQPPIHSNEPSPTIPSLHLQRAGFLELHTIDFFFITTNATQTRSTKTNKPLTRLTTTGAVKARLTHLARRRIVETLGKQTAAIDIALCHAAAARLDRVDTCRAIAAVLLVDAFVRHAHHTRARRTTRRTDT
jgi:hypothetical protein